MSLGYRILAFVCLLFTALAGIHLAFGGLWEAPAITVIVLVGIAIAFLKVVFPKLFVPR